MKVFICENCGKQFEEGYGKRNRFCTRSCCSSYSAKKSWSNPTEKRVTHLQSMRNSKKSKSFLEKEEKEGTCRFCGRICKNQNSLRNHERLCKSNPEYESNVKALFTDKKLKSYKDKKGTLHGQIPIEVTCRFCGKKWIATKSGWSNHENHCSENPNRKDGTFKGKHHSEETKKKISEGVKKWCDRHPEELPYVKYHSSKESYPEKYFREVLENNSIKFEQEFVVSRYSLDFAFPDIKKYFEVDGKQHEYMTEHDKIREEFLKEKGWKLICRIQWWKFKELNPEDQKQYCEDLIKNIMGC